MTVHPIEEESYRILAERIDLSAWDEGPAAVAARVVHATADPGLVHDLVVDEPAVAAGTAALGRGAPVLCDVEMVRAGISAATARCALGEVTGAAPYPTRSAAAMARLAERHPHGAVVAVGCAPSALAEVVRRIEAGTFRPALVVGVPVGYVGAADSKERLVSVAAASGIPAISLRGERGGAAVAAAIVNALGRRAALGPVSRPACLFIGHGTRSASGEAELRSFTEVAAAARPDVASAPGFIEFLEPGLDEAVDSLVERGAASIVAVPLVLLAAGHLKDDGPAALARGRVRHPHVSFSYARDFGVHPDVLSVVTERAAACAITLPGGDADAVVVVGRGSTDPDANADLAKAARLLADGRGLTAGGAPLGLVEPAFVSLAHPQVAAALDRCAALGARRIAVVPYFLFDGLLVDRIRQQAAAWAGAHPGHAVATGTQMGIDPRIVALAWHRYDEALGGDVRMNCDGCLYRAPLPGYEHRVGAPPFG